MSEITLDNEHLGVTLDTDGGVIWRLIARTVHGNVPLLRPPRDDVERGPRNSGCYPLAPFGNRIAGNTFAYDGGQYRLKPNVADGLLNVHGDGWQKSWTVVSATLECAELRIESRDEDFPIAYDATQRFEISGRTLSVSMKLVNRGDRPMPFGLGWHPYFPLHDDTTLLAPARSYWEEGDLHLPVRMTHRPPELDFDRPRPLPRRWINNGFEGWSGHAVISSRKSGVRTEVSASDALGRYFLFSPEPTSDPSSHGDFFAFEPMSHTANAHNLESDYGLVRLEPGETMTGQFRITWSISA